MVRWIYWAQSLELYIVDACCSAAVAIDVRKPVRIDVSTSRCRAPVALALGLIGHGSRTYKTKIVHVFFLFAFFFRATIYQFLLSLSGFSESHTSLDNIPASLEGTPRARLLLLLLLFQIFLLLHTMAICQ